MPFIPRVDRDKPFAELEHGTEGEKCFVSYRSMIRMWKATPRWATVDHIATAIWPEAFARARILAFLVFFILHVMPYEIKKRKEHGEVE